MDGLRLIGVNQLLAGKEVLITAGPTREALDPVRYISNYSSGKMGYAMAEAAAVAGAQVTLISGPTQLTSSASIRCVRVESAESMYHEVLTHLRPGMIYIGAAAVADYTVESQATQKLKKQDTDSLNVHLVKTHDILTAVAQSGRASYVAGFAAETEDLIRYAEDKLERKKVDMVIANLVGKGKGFDCDDNEVIVITKNKHIELELAHKTAIAGQIIAIIAANLQNASQLSN
jgi:phosphopantothenoylcysteine decarboxylase/phosphopantothenate--cysteine ligase